MSQEDNLIYIALLWDNLLGRPHCCNALMPDRTELHEVFTVSGIPRHTFVPPNEYTRLLVALKTPGRGIVVEGPSGIGKTTAVVKAIEEAGIPRP
jgi:hypothetical protein